MSLPTKSDLSTLNYAYLGQPMVVVSGTSAVNTSTLNYTYLGQPIVAVYPLVSQFFVFF
jgi:hypothetical protein